MKFEDYKGIIANIAILHNIVREVRRVLEFNLRHVSPGISFEVNFASKFRITSVN